MLSLYKASVCVLLFNYMLWLPFLLMYFYSSNKGSAIPGYIISYFFSNISNYLASSLSIWARIRFYLHC